MIKLYNETLTESNEEEVIIEENPQLELTQKSIINDLLKGELDTINVMNGAIQSLKDSNCGEDILSALEEVLRDEYMHVGLYKQLMVDSFEDAKAIEDGEEELAEVQEESAEEVEDIPEEQPTEAQESLNEELTMRDEHNALRILDDEMITWLDSEIIDGELKICFLSQYEAENAAYVLAKAGYKCGDVVVSEEDCSVVQVMAAPQIEEECKDYANNLGD